MSYYWSFSSRSNDLVNKVIKVDTFYKYNVELYFVDWGTYFYGFNGGGWANTKLYYYSSFGGLIERNVSVSTL
jgi:hypothetical protein